MDADRTSADPLEVEAVLFDLDDTICEYRHTQDELLAVAFDRRRR